MAIAHEPGDHEAELPGDWPPCPHSGCGSTTRVAFATMKHRHIGFYCGSGHRHEWREDNGSSGYWIGKDHFRPGGRFEGILPQDLVGVLKAKASDRRIDVNERRLDWIRTEQRACAVCRIPDMRDWHDRKKVYFWLKEHHPRLFEAIEGILKVANPKPTYQNWMEVVRQVNSDLLVEVNHKIQDSHLQADHSVPADVLKELWPSLTPAMQAIATGTLVFGLCRPDNNGKSNRLPLRDELLRLHIQLNHDGNEAVARADSNAWKTLEGFLDVLDEYRRRKSDVTAPGVENVTA